MRGALEAAAEGWSQARKTRRSDESACGIIRIWWTNPKFALQISTKLNLWNCLSQFSLSKSVHVNTSATVHKSFEL